MKHETPAPDDYTHRLHAGNVGDVWKHVVLLATIRALAAPGRPPLRYVETHAGEGRYRLGPTGEWTEGIGRLRDAIAGPAPAAVESYLAAAQAAAPGEREHAGSPLLALGALRPEDHALLFERDPAARAALELAVGRDPRARVVEGDGLAALPETLHEPGQTLVLVDPSWAGKSDWATVPDAIVRAARAAPGARFLLWYPIKSWTRPTALARRVRDSGVPATLVELVTTPTELRFSRLNGSGVLLVRAPDGVAAEVLAAAPALGAALATHAGFWAARGAASRADGPSGR
jgi:23S rRNA (adenine2030-N6)-methyltransferase